MDSEQLSDRASDPAEDGGRRQQSDVPPPIDDELPAGIHLPNPTVWPAVLASGVTMLLWGFVTNFAVSLAGAVIGAVAVAGWIEELRREARRQHESAHAQPGGPGR